MIKFQFKFLLCVAAILAKQKLMCGISSDELLKSKALKEMLFPFSKRKENTQHALNRCREFLPKLEQTQNFEFDLFPLCDPFGPTITDPTINAMVCSEETKKGCEKINLIRKEKGFQPVEIVCIPCFNFNGTEFALFFFSFKSFESF